jgi:arylsulfatase A-like enzyme
MAKQNAPTQQNTATQTKPNILVIWGDDIGITNLSCYSDGVMGYRTPNIDRIATEGMKFTRARRLRHSRLTRRWRR